MQLKSRLASSSAQGGTCRSKLWVPMTISYLRRKSSLLRGRMEISFHRNPPLGSKQPELWVCLLGRWGRGLLLLPLVLLWERLSQESAQFLEL